MLSASARTALNDQKLLTGLKRQLAEACWARITSCARGRECLTNGDSYLNIDDDTPYSADKDSYDDNNILEENASKKTQVEASLAIEDDDEDNSKPIVMHTTARRSVQLLKH